MQRYKLVIEYEGTCYHGWQRQDSLPTVQGAIERAFSRLHLENIGLMVAGRTDAGVHARMQIAHCDLNGSNPEKYWHPVKLRNALNAHLSQASESITLLMVEEVPACFHARFSAIKRHYLYKILNRNAPPTLDKNRSWWIPRLLNIEKMQDAAQILIGHHDFTTFRSTQCQATSPFRTLDRLDVKCQGEWIEIYASARSFLHHQVRSMVGSLAEVGFGRWSEKDMERALQARERSYCGVVAPACGLYLIGVDYPEKISQNTRNDTIEIHENG